MLLQVLCIYIYSQVGTGFSYTDKGGMSTNEEQVADNLYSCITQFLTVFSEYQASEFYVTGEVNGVGWVHVSSNLNIGVGSFINH